MQEAATSSVNLYVWGARAGVWVRVKGRGGGSMHMCAGRLSETALPCGCVVKMSWRKPKHVSLGSGGRATVVVGGAGEG